MKSLERYLAEYLKHEMLLNDTQNDLEYWEIENIEHFIKEGIEAYESIYYVRVNVE